VTPMGQTFSSGVATWNVEETPDHLVRRSAAALNAAKCAGRDRTVNAEAPETPDSPETRR
jgi:PleD family two-component response regulator